MAATISHDLAWTVTKGHSATLVKRANGVQFSRDPLNLKNLYSRKNAYILGLLGYAVGAIAMALAQDLTAIIVFWAIVGGLGASLLLLGIAFALPQLVRRTRRLVVRARTA